MQNILIISEKNNHEVKAITAFLPPGSWFHLVLDVIHSRYELYMDVSLGTFTLCDNETKREIRSAQLKTVWLPRLDFMYEEGFHENEKMARFFAMEYHSVIDGLIACVEKQNTLIVTRPDATYAAGNKIRQQLVAGELGLPLPSQIITNRKKFLLKQPWINRAIFKPVHSGNLHYDSEEEQSYMSKPVILSPTLLKSIKKKEMDLTVHYFQEYLKFIAEYRVVVFGEHVFPFRISGNYDIDWRNYMQSIMITLQKDFIYAEQCLKYNRYFNLGLGCFDFIQTKDGMYFIECNPPGYILFCDPENKAGMLETFAKYLACGNNFNTK